MLILLYPPVFWEHRCSLVTELYTAMPPKGKKNLATGKKSTSRAVKKISATCRGKPMCVFQVCGKSLVSGVQKPMLRIKAKTPEQNPSGAYSLPVRSGHLTVLL